MASRKSARVHKPRELRRRVVVPARLRDGISWSDTCILNVSSRGMMIQTSSPLTEGKTVEIRRGDHVILARVVWRDGARTGLQADERVPVDEIMTIGQSLGLQLTADGERRKQPRTEDHSRQQARALEFVGAIVIAVGLASAAMLIVQEAFAKPIAMVAAALGG